MDFDGSVLHAKVEQPATIVLIVLRIPGCTRDSATGTIILLTCKHHVYTSILRCFIQLLPPYIAIAVCVSIASCNDSLMIKIREDQVLEQVTKKWQQAVSR